MRLALVLFLAAGLAGITYFWLERLGRRGIVPALCRTVAWASLGLLLFNISCPVPGLPRRPLVLLDGSLSLTAAGGRWAEARALAERLGDVRTFGDERAGTDTAAVRGRSLLAPALAATSALDRPVIVVSDGEIEDLAQVPADILGRVAVRLVRRVVRPDLAITAVQGPARVTAGDTIPLEVDLVAVGRPAPARIALDVTAGQTRVLRQEVAFGAATVRVRVRVPSRSLPAGDHLLRVSLVDARDAEPRTDVRVHLVTVAPTPGVVLVAAPGDWDSRFLFRTIRDVAQLPVRGYVRIDAEHWRSMSDLAPVSADQVARAARQADLLIVKGATDEFAASTRARGVLVWPSGEGGENTVSGDWYLAATGASPLAGAFLGQPIDSFPPAVQLTPMQVSDSDWVALTAQEGRRGADKPVVIGRESGRKRRVTVAADGLWRWAFRGGASEQTYRAWVAATVSWLLGAADSARGDARPIRPVVQNGRPLVFEWTGRGAPTAAGIVWTSAAGATPDTLRFDGAGRATVWLAPGDYRYRLAGGGAGTASVETYSDEFLPRPVVLTARETPSARPTQRSAARDWLWLFGVAVLALSGEWFARRRLGLK